MAGAVLSSWSSFSSVVIFATRSAARRSALARAAEFAGLAASSGAARTAHGAARARIAQSAVLAPLRRHEDLNIACTLGMDI